MTADDYFAIQALIHSYPGRLDAGDLAGMAQLFADADVYFPGGEVCRSDPAAVEKAFRDFLRLYEGGIPRTRHMISNVIIQPESDNAARATSYVMVFQQTDALPLQPIIGGDYQDAFVRRDGLWRFSKRIIRNDLFGDLSAHGKYDFAPR